MNRARITDKSARDMLRELEDGCLIDERRMAAAVSNALSEEFDVSRGVCDLYAAAPRLAREIVHRERDATLTDKAVRQSIVLLSFIVGPPLLAALTDASAFKSACAGALALLGSAVFTDIAYQMKGANPSKAALWAYSLTMIAIWALPFVYASGRVL